MALSKLTGLFSGGGNVPVPGVSSGGSSSGSFSARLAGKQAAAENQRRWEIQQAQAAEQRAYNRSRMAQSDARASAMHGVNMTNAGLLTDQRQHAINRQGIVDAQNDFKYGQATRVGDVNLETAENALAAQKQAKEDQAMADLANLSGSFETLKPVEEEIMSQLPANEMAKLINYGIGEGSNDGPGGIGFDPGDDKQLNDIKQLLAASGVYPDEVQEGDLSPAQIAVRRRRDLLNQGEADGNINYRDLDKKKEYEAAKETQAALSEEYSRLYDKKLGAWKTDIMDEFGTYKDTKKGKKPKSRVELIDAMVERAKKLFPGKPRVQSMAVNGWKAEYVEPQRRLNEEYENRAAEFKRATANDAVKAKQKTARNESNAKKSISSDNAARRKYTRAGYKMFVESLEGTSQYKRALAAWIKGDWKTLDSIGN